MHVAVIFSGRSGWERSMETTSTVRAIPAASWAALHGDHAPVVVRPPHELDLLTGQRLVSTVARISAIPPVPHVNLVLDRVTFADVSGVRAVFACRDMVRACGADLVLVDPSPAVRRILDLAPGLDKRCEGS
jgi:anti-anti-sigma factor